MTALGPLVDRAGRLLDAEPRREPFEITRGVGGPLRDLWTSIPVWARILVIYLVSRLFTTAMMVAFASSEGQTWQTSAKPGYLEFANIWDAKWYSRIASGGYPSELPVSPEGHITESAWAFMPVYPMLVRLIMAATTLPFEPVAVAVSLLAGLGCAYAVHRLFRHLVDPDAAMFGVLLVCIMPTSVVFQVGYADGLHAFLLAVLLVLLVERRWMLMVPIVLIASFTRPTGLAWALTLVLVFLWRWHRDRRGREPFTRSERIDVGIVTAISIVSGFGWLIIAGIVTGVPSAYLDTEFAWRSRYTGWDVYHGPFSGWIQGAHFWIDYATGRSLPEPWRDLIAWGGGTLLVVLFFGACAWLLLGPIGRRLGAEVRLWALSYLAYILAVFFPQSSTFRLLMPLFPTLAVVAVPKSPLYRVLMVIGSLVGQVVWFLYCWYVMDGDWSPP